MDILQYFYSYYVTETGSTFKTTDPKTDPHYNSFVKKVTPYLHYPNPRNPKINHNTPLLESITQLRKHYKKPEPLPLQTIQEFEQHIVSGTPLELAYNLLTSLPPISRSRDVWEAAAEQNPSPSTSLEKFFIEYCTHINANPHIIQQLFLTHKTFITELVGTNIQYLVDIADHPNLTGETYELMYRNYPEFRGFMGMNPSLPSETLEHYIDRFFKGVILTFRNPTTSGRKQADPTASKYVLLQNKLPVIAHPSITETQLSRLIEQYMSYPVDQIEPRDHEAIKNYFYLAPTITSAQKNILQKHV